MTSVSEMKDSFGSRERSAQLRLNRRSFDAVLLLSRCNRRSFDSAQDDESEVGTQCWFAGWLHVSEDLGDMTRVVASHYTAPDPPDN